MGSKSLFVSKTFWLNLVLGGLAIVDSSTSQLVSPQVHTAIILVSNLINRMFTEQPVHLVDPSKNGQW